MASSGCLVLYVFGPGDPAADIEGTRSVIDQTTGTILKQCPAVAYMGGESAAGRAFEQADGTVTLYTSETYFNVFSAAGTRTAYVDQAIAAVGTSGTHAWGWKLDGSTLYGYKITAATNAIVETRTVDTSGAGETLYGLTASPAGVLYYMKSTTADPSTADWVLKAFNIDTDTAVGDVVTFANGDMFPAQAGTYQSYAHSVLGDGTLLLSLQYDGFDTDYYYDSAFVQLDETTGAVLNTYFQSLHATEALNVQGMADATDATLGWWWYMDAGAVVFASFTIADGVVVDALDTSTWPVNVADNPYGWMPYVSTVTQSETTCAFPIISDDTPTGEGNIRWLRRSPHAVNELKRVFYRRFELLMDVGNSGSAFLDPVVYMRYSNDGGRTYGTARAARYGVQGAVNKRVFWTPCGSGRDRVFEVYGDDPAPVRIVDAYIEVTPGLS